MSGNNSVNSDLITNSIGKVDRFFYTHYEDGSPVYQISAETIIEQMIRMLAPHPGDRFYDLNNNISIKSTLKNSPVDLN